MGKIIRNGINYGGTYEDATSVNYDNTNSGLNARTVQEGIDELHGNVDVLSDNIDTLNERLEYSTEEKVVGTWIDGKPIYKKSYGASGLSATSNIIIDAELNNTTVDNVIKIEGSANGNGHSFFQRQSYAGDSQYSCFFRIEKTNGLTLEMVNYTVYKYAVTVYYTKN